PTAAPHEATSTGPGDRAPSGSVPDTTHTPEPAPAPGVTSPREQAMAAAREARRASLSHGAAATPEAAPEPEPDFDLDPNDPDIESTGHSGAPLVARLLGGTGIYWSNECGDMDGLCNQQTG